VLAKSQLQVMSNHISAKRLLYARLRVHYVYIFMTLFSKRLRKGRVATLIGDIRKTCLPVVCEKAAPTESDRVNKLLDILLRRDDQLLPSFCDLLKVTQQPHIVRILCRNGQQHTLSHFRLLAY